MKFFSNSAECTKSELDLFYVPPTNTSIESGGWCFYPPTSAIDDFEGPIEFTVPASEDEYIHLTKTLLYMKLDFMTKHSVKTEQGKKETESIVKVESKDIFGPVNNLASSLFNQIDVEMNSDSIEPSDKTYAYKAYLTDLLNFGDDAKNTFLQSSMFYKDSFDAMDSIELDTSKPNRNDGFIQRRNLITKGNGSVELLTRLHCDLFNCERYLLSKVNLRIKLMRNKTQFYLMGNDTARDVKVIISSAFLFIRKARINPDIIIAHQMALQKATAKYPIKRTVVKAFPINDNVQNFSTPNLGEPMLPLRVIAGMVDSRAFNGSFAHNPFNFQHFNVSEVSLTLDSKNIPYYKPLKLDFKSNQYVRGYYTLFEGIDRPVFLTGNGISLREYSNGYTLFAFDISPDLCSGDHFNLIKKGNLTLDLSFDKNLEQPIILIVYMEFDNMIEINSSRKVIKDYQT